MSARFHRGDRVYGINGQHGVVEGWKDGMVLVCWGLQQVHQGYLRSWELADSLTFVDPVDIPRDVRGA